LSFQLVEAEKANYPVTVLCRTLGVSTAGFYAWRHAQTHPCQRRRDDTELVERIREIHRISRRSYGSPRVFDELKLGEGRRVGRKRIERLMRINGIVGIHKRRRGCTRRDPETRPSDDLVNRQFSPDGPDRLWCADVTEHSTGDGKVYLAVVLDAWSRRVVGWSIADHMRAELVVDALQMAAWRRRPTAGQTVHHSDHGSQYTSWAFGRRLRAAGVLGSMGSIGDAFDNAMAESFFSILQRELLDTQSWATRRQLALAVFEWIEAWYNPRRRHTGIGSISPIDFEAARAGVTVTEAA
jgi:putative transposase